MYKKSFECFDEIKAPENIVDKAVKRAMAVDVRDVKAKSGINLCRPKKKLVVGVLAACFAAVFVFSAVFGFGAERDSMTTQSKGFVITANAYEAKRLEGNADSAVIGAYTGELSGGWAMYYNLEQYKDCSPNFFQSYVFSDFTIEGKGIESVVFKSNAEGTYFAISPAGVYCDTDENKAMGSYSQLSLTNSQYSADELKAYSDGLSYGEIYADTFTFTNTERSEKIDFGKKLEFVIESNHNNPQISQKLDRLWECEQQANDYKAEHTYEGGEISIEEEKLYNEIDILSEEIRELILKDATVDVIINFIDGSTLRKSLKMGLVRADGTLWLTISEIC